VLGCKIANSLLTQLSSINSAEKKTIAKVEKDDPRYLVSISKNAAVYVEIQGISDKDKNAAARLIRNVVNDFIKEQETTKPPIKAGTQVGGTSQGSKI